MKEAIIKLSNLSKHYGQFVAVDRLNLEVNRGEVFGLLGPNGAGKTTTILMMLGLTEPNEGTAHVCGFSAARDPLNVKRKVGYMPDNVGFYNHMTALENLVYIARLNSIEEKRLQERAKTLLDMVGLGAEMNKKAGTFSLGMKQRLGLAEVLIKSPEVIVLDEPTLGIDPAGVKDFLEMIRSLSRQHGLTVLLSSHHLHHVQQVCDRVGIFVRGKLLAQGDVPALSSSLFGKEGHITTVSTVQTILQPWQLEPEMRSWPEIKDISFAANSIEFSSTREITPDIVRLLVTNGYDILSVKNKEFGLDEIYQKYFEHSFNEDTNNGKSANFFTTNGFTASRK